MRYIFQVRFIHISDTRMVIQVTNGLSRGSFYKGVMNNKPMLSFLPLGGSMLERSEPLGRRIKKWASNIGMSVETLDPEGWFSGDMIMMEGNIIYMDSVFLNSVQ